MNNQVGVGYDSHVIRDGDVSRLEKITVANLSMYPVESFNVSVPADILCLLYDKDRMIELLSKKGVYDLTPYRSDSCHDTQLPDQIIPLTEEDLLMSEIMTLAVGLARLASGDNPYDQILSHESEIQAIMVTNYVISQMLEIAFSIFTSTGDVPSETIGMFKRFQIEMEKLGYLVSFKLLSELVKIDPALAYLYAEETGDLGTLDYLFDPHDLRNPLCWDERVISLGLHQGSSAEIRAQLYRRAVKKLLLSRHKVLSVSLLTELIRPFIESDDIQSARATLDRISIDDIVYSPEIISVINSFIIQDLVYRSQLTSERASFLIRLTLLSGDIRNLTHFIKSLYVFANEYTTGRNPVLQMFSLDRADGGGNDCNTGISRPPISGSILTTILSSLKRELEVWDYSDPWYDQRRVEMLIIHINQMLIGLAREQYSGVPPNLDFYLGFVEAGELNYLTRSS